MKEADVDIVNKIMELQTEMKLTGLWQKEPPAWVNYFEENIFTQGKDFAQWLQYVFIPNHLQKENFAGVATEKKFIIPAAIKFFGNDMQKGKLLQILIEIDSMI